jgi:hypothetical protein
MSVLPVTTNPYIIEHLDYKAQEKEIMIASHLLEVEGVYAEGKLNETVFDLVRIFCANHRIQFGIRIFNSAAFIQDRECITKLPAFHIYYKDEYEKSFYPGDDPAVQIQYMLNEIKNYNKPKRTQWSWKFPKIKWKWSKKSRVASSDVA